MPKTRQQKELAVQKLTEKLKTAKSMVFTDFRGMTMSQISEVRKSLREQKADFNVTKNNLLQIALKDAGFTVNDESFLSGPVATMVAYDDEITPIKALTKAFKDASIGKVKAGFLGTDFLDAKAVTTLASLPSKQELRGQVVGVLVAPIRGIVTVLNGNLRNLAVVLDQIRAQKAGE